MSNVTNTVIRVGALRIALAMTLALAVSVSLTQISAAEQAPPVNGIVVGVETDDDGSLTRFAVSDSTGTVHTFTIFKGTEYGLENQAGDRWISTQEEEPTEAARRLRDHRERFAPITVTSENGTAFSVIEREEGKLETNLSYLFAVFVITWALFFTYVIYLGRKQRVLQHEITRLKGASGK
jgi:CcmD family protein